jgi:hypothetical protein
MLMSQWHVLRMFLKCMRGGNSQHADGNCATYEEENLVHGDSQPNA